MSYGRAKVYKVRRLVQCARPQLGIGWFFIARRLELCRLQTWRLCQTSSSSRRRWVARGSAAALLLMPRSRSGMSVHMLQTSAGSLGLSLGSCYGLS